MKLWDYHIHTKLCNHATGNVEDYVKMAIQKNLGEIGLSDHFPMHLLSKEAEVEGYAMTLEQFPEYIDECLQAKERFKKLITVKIASEVDYSPTVFKQYKELVLPFLDDMDYLIGSIHVIKIPGTDTFAIDGPIANDKFSYFGEDKIFIAYYDELIQMVNTGFYNIVGHLDLPKKYGKFLGDSEKIWQKLENLLDVIENQEMVVEINHSGYYKPVGVQYPDDKIIRELVKRKIPIVLGSDSHNVKYIAYNFEKSLSKLKRMQNEEKVSVNLCKFSKRKKELIKLDSVF